MVFVELLNPRVDLFDDLLHRPNVSLRLSSLLEHLRLASLKSLSLSAQRREAVLDQGENRTRFTDRLQSQAAELVRGET